MNNAEKATLGRIYNMLTCISVKGQDVLLLGNAMVQLQQMLNQEEGES